MEYKTNFDINTFHFWDGAKDRIEEIRKLDRADELLDELQKYIEQQFVEPPTATDINDIVWFDCDDRFLNELLEVRDDSKKLEEDE